MCDIRELQISPVSCEKVTGVLITGCAFCSQHGTCHTQLDKIAYLLCTYRELHRNCCYLTTALHMPNYNALQCHTRPHHISIPHHTYHLPRFHYSRPQHTSHLPRFFFSGSSSSILPTTSGYFAVSSLRKLYRGSWSIMYFLPAKTQAATQHVKRGHHTHTATSAMKEGASPPHNNSINWQNAL